MRNKALLCAMALAAAPAHMHAEEVGHWYVTPQAGGLWTDDDRGLEDEDWLFGLAVGKHVSDAWSIELNVNTATLDSPIGSEIDMHAGSIDVLRVFARDAVVSPYLTVGAGALQLDPSGGSDTSDFMMQAGLGMLVHAWTNERSTRTFSLRPEVKARWSDAGRPDHFVDYIAALGFQFSFGAARPVPVAQPAPQPPVAPPAAVAPPAPPPPPADTDGDGVVDPDDRCPGTPRGVAIDAVGCPQKGSVTLEGVTFELNSVELTADSRPLLARVAADLAKYPKLRIEVQGHTDGSGSDRYNMQLSQRRASAVRDYLISQGVAPGQVEARGYGESMLIADDRTAEGRARNRRVVLSVLDNPGNVEVERERQP
jgi:OOP family OmpA-OmpF porin